MNATTKKVLPWIFPIIVALILLHTLPFKFTAAPQSVALFTKIGLFGLPEAFGRIGVGIFELIGSVLILVPKTRKIGSYLVMALMAGAIFFHATKLGFGGESTPLTIMAILAFLLSAIASLQKRK